MHYVNPSLFLLASITSPPPQQLLENTSFSRPLLWRICPARSPPLTLCTGLQFAVPNTFHATFPGIRRRRVASWGRQSDTGHVFLGEYLPAMPFFCLPFAVLLVALPPRCIVAQGPCPPVKSQAGKVHDSRRCASRLEIFCGEYPFARLASSRLRSLSVPTPFPLVWPQTMRAGSTRLSAVECEVTVSQGERPHSQLSCERTR